MPLSRCSIRDADLEVRPDLGCLRRATGEEVYLRPKTFQTLLLLLEQRHRVVTKEEIVAHVWPETAVTDDALVQCIVEIRKTLGDDAKQSRFIRTLPKSGYRFVGDVDLMDASPDEPAASTHEAAASPPVPALPARPAPDRTVRNRRLLVSAALVVVAVAVAGYLKATDPAASVDLSETLASREPHRPRLAVMFLENESHTPELEWLREGLADMLVTGLSRSRGVSVVGRQQLNLLLDRVGHTSGSSIDLAKAITVASRANLDHMVLGGFAKLGNTIRVDLRLHDASGRLVATEALTIEAPGDLLKQVDTLSWRLAQHFGEVSAVAPAPATMLTNNLEAFRYYSLGVAQANHYHNPEAIELLTKATELDPEFAMAYGRIGYAYGVTWSQTERARPFLAKAYALSHRLSEEDRLQVEAWNALVHLDYDSAARTLSELIRRFPLQVEPYVRLGMVQAGERRYDEAIQTFQRGLAVDPESTDLWNRLGGIYDESGRSSEGIAARQKYVALQPKEANAYDSLGGSFYTAGRYGDAEAAFQRALQLDAEFDVVWVHLGNTYVHTGQYVKAEAAYRRYLAVASSNDERRRAYSALAVLAHRRGQKTQAAALMVRARPVAPFGLDAPIRLDAGESVERVAASFREPADSPNRGSRLGQRVLKYAQGMIALKRGDADALRHFEAALRERPVFFQADWLEACLADAYLALGRFDDAIAEYTRVLRVHPRYPLVRYRLGLAFERKGQDDLARRAFQEFLNEWRDADPDIWEVVSAKAKLAGYTKKS